MKRAALLLAVILMLVPAISEACIQKLKADKDTVKIGDRVTVTASIKWIHDRCELETKDVNFDFRGLVKVSQTRWRRTGKGQYQSEMVVRITAQNAEIRMWRRCSRAGRHGTELKFKYAAPKNKK